MVMIKGIEIDFDANTTNLDQAFRKLNGEARKAQSELRGINTLMRMNPKSVALASQKTQLLAKNVKEAELKQQELNKALEEAQASEVDRSSAAYRKLEREAELAKIKVEQLKKEQMEWMASQSRMGKLSTSMTNFGNRVSKAAGKMKYLSLAAAGVAGIALKVGMDFDEGMSKVAAVSGASGDELQALRDKAKQMGATTKFSATEAAEAMNYMAMAGWKSKDMIGGIEGVMNLAAASGEDLATTSDIVTDALTAFGLQAADSGHFADVLAAASSNANTNVSMMGETFKYAAPIAGSLGYSVEDVAESIGLMANAGIKSSQAGTSLRRIMSSLTKNFTISGKKIGDVTIKTTKADGSMRKWSDIIQDTRKAFSGLSESEQTTAARTLVGQNAMSGFLALMNASPKDIKKLEDALGKADGAAKSMADTMLDNTKGSLTILKSTLESAGISISETLAPTVTQIVKHITDLVNKFNELSPATKDMIAKAVAMTAAAYPLLKIVGGISTGIGGLLKPLSLFTTKMKEGEGVAGKFGSLLAKIPGPAKLAVGAFGALALAIKVHEDRIHGATKAYNEGKKAREENVAQALAEASETDHLNDRLQELMAVEDKSVGQKATIKSIVEKLNEKVSGLNLTYDEEKDALNKSTTAIQNKINAMKTEAEVAAYQDAITDAFKSRLAAETELEEKERALADARERYENAKKSGADEDEVQGLASNVQAARAAYDDAAEAVANCDEEIDKYNNKILKAKGESVKAGKSVYYASTEFNRLKRVAGNVGYVFSNKLIKGFQQGKIKVPQTVKQMKRAIRFDDILRRATNAGINIPNRISSGIISGKYAVPKSVKEVENLVKWDKMVRRAEKAGVRVDKNLSKQIRKGGNNVSAATETLRRRINKKLDSAASHASTSGKNATKNEAKGLKNKGALNDIDSATDTVSGKVKGGLDIDTTSLGASITEGIASGMLSQGPLGILGGAISGLRNYVIRNSDKKFKHNSPAKVMFPLGESIPEGVAVGMNRGLGFINHANQNLLERVTSMKAPGYGSLVNYDGTLKGSAALTSGAGVQNLGGNVINNRITVSGGSNPEEFAARLARQIKLQLRTV